MELRGGLPPPVPRPVEAVESQLYRGGVEGVYGALLESGEEAPVLARRELRAQPLEMVEQWQPSAAKFPTVLWQHFVMPSHQWDGSDSTFQSLLASQPIHNPIFYRGFAPIWIVKPSGGAATYAEILLVPFEIGRGGDI